MAIGFSSLVICLAFLLVPAVLADGPTAAPAAEYLHFGPSGFTWPTTDQWISLSTLNDPDDGLADDHLDFVGDASDPGFYYHSGVNYVYFRIRVDFGGPVTSSTFGDTVMILLDRGGDGSPDYGFAWDSKKAGHGLEMVITDTIGTTWATTRMTDLDGNVAQKVAPPDINTTGDGYVRTIDGVNTTNFGTTTFIDIAVSWSYLYARTSLRKDETWGIQLGSIRKANHHNFIDYDVAGNRAPNQALSFPGTISTSPTAAVLSILTAAAHREGVTVSWETESELDIGGFHLYRATAEQGPWIRANSEMIRSQAPGSPQGFRYAWTDRAAPNGMCWYRLVSVGLDGQETLLGTTHIYNSFRRWWLPMLPR